MRRGWRRDKEANKSIKAGKGFYYFFTLLLTNWQLISNKGRRKRRAKEANKPISWNWKGRKFNSN